MPAHHMNHRGGVIVLEPPSDALSGAVELLSATRRIEPDIVVVREALLEYLACIRRGRTVGNDLVATRVLRCKGYAKCD